MDPKTSPTKNRFFFTIYIFWKIKKIVKGNPLQPIFFYSGTSVWIQSISSFSSFIISVSNLARFLRLNGYVYDGGPNFIKTSAPHESTNSTLGPIITSVGARSGPFKSYGPFRPFMSWIFKWECQSRHSLKYFPEWFFDSTTASITSVINIKEYNIEVFLGQLISHLKLRCELWPLW